MKDILRRPVRDLSRRLLPALLLALVMAGGLRVHTVYSQRTACSECDQYSPWQWEYWWFECFDPPPPNCADGG